MLALRDGLCLSYPDLIPHFGGISLIVHEVFFAATNVLFVLRMLDEALHRNSGSIFHGRLYNGADEHFSFVCVWFHTNLREQRELEVLMSRANFTARACGAYCGEMWRATHHNVFRFESKIGAGWQT